MAIQALAVGERVRALLPEGGRARVVGRTSQAVFLEVGGEIVWVAGPSGVRHRRAVLATAVPTWPVGAEVAVCREVLGSSPELEIEGAQLWWSPPLPVPSPYLGPGAQACWEALSVEGDGTLRSWAWTLAEVTRKGGPDEAIAWGKRIVGLGPGLTPLGDDLLGGAMFAMRVVGVGGPQWADFLAWAQPRTSRLSGCLLVDLACGYGPEPLHGLAEALCGGWQEPAAASVQKLGQLGQSTGRALLIGALAVWATSKEWSRR